MAGLVEVQGPPFGGVFSGTRVLVTGHTGFKGAWLSRWLLELGAEVYGLALEPDTTPSLYADLQLDSCVRSRIGDIRDTSVVVSAVSAAKPEFVFHLAAQPLVRRSYEDPVYTFDTNVMGTVRLLDALRSCESMKVLVCVTTDKVYENPETGLPFKEDSPLGGHDPYSASKAATEMAVASYRDSFFAPLGGAAVASARAGNVVGGGDWAVDRIIPDCIRALQHGAEITVRNPGAVRPWQHVLEPLSGYLRLAQMLTLEEAQCAEPWNFGPDPSNSYTVEDVVRQVVEVWGAGSWVRPHLDGQPHEAATLVLDISKARGRLHWQPVWDFETTIRRTVDWYRAYASGQLCAEEATSADINAYASDAAAAGAAWIK